MGVRECKECMEQFAAGLEHERTSADDRNVMKLKIEGLCIALGQDKSSPKGQALLETFDQTSSGDVSFREFVAALATPAGMSTGSKESFYKRATIYIGNQ